MVFCLFSYMVILNDFVQQKDMTPAESYLYSNNEFF